MTDNAYTTEEALAEKFGISLRNARELRAKHGWPHMRFGRFGIRYTAFQVAAIEDLMTVKRKAEKKQGGIPGQTEGSKKRAS